MTLSNRKSKRLYGERKRLAFQTLETRQLLACDVTGSLFQPSSGTPHTGLEIDVSIRLDEGQNASGGNCLINVASAADATTYNFNGRLDATNLGSALLHEITVILTANGNEVGRTDLVAGPRVPIPDDPMAPGRIEVYTFDIPAIAASALPDDTYTMQFNFERTDIPLPISLSPFQLEVNRTPPGSPAAPDLRSTSDSGASDTDNRTNANELVFDVQLASGSTDTIEIIELLRDTDEDGDPSDDLIVATENNPSATVILTDQNAPDGTFFYTARIRDTSGNESFSPALQITVDRTSPDPLGNFRLSTESDSLQPGLGFAATGADGLTFDSTPTFSFSSINDLGTDVLKVFDGATEISRRRRLLWNRHRDGDSSLGGRTT